MRLSYKGTAYHGWQNQPNALSVQQTLEEALATLLRAKVNLVGAGRTDAGVHARIMVAHFDFPGDPIDCDYLKFRLNNFLPPDIAVSSVKPAASDFHARFSARSRTYKYFVNSAKDAFRSDYELLIRFDPDFELMNEAAAMLLTYSDFSSFSKSHTDVKTNICKVTHARWENLGDGRWCFTITADRFLRNMVRAIVGTLFEVGKRRMTLAQFAELIEKKDRRSAGSSAPPQGLFLYDIEY